MISEESFKRKADIFGVGYYSPKSITEYPRVRIPKEIQNEAYSYCQENFGDNWIWSSPTQTDYTDVYFIESADSLIFKLKFKSA